MGVLFWCDAMEFIYEFFGYGLVCVGRVWEWGFYLGYAGIGQEDSGITGFVVGSFFL